MYSLPLRLSNQVEVHPRKNKSKRRLKLNCLKYKLGKIYEVKKEKNRQKVITSQV